MIYYIYCADVYCEACGKAICERLNSTIGEPAEFRPAKVPNSDVYPVECNDAGTSDCPQHCGSGAECLEPTIIDNYVDDPVGKFLENDLTADGIEDVIEAFLENPKHSKSGNSAQRNGMNVARFWMQWYVTHGYDMQTDFHGFTLSLSHKPI